MCKEINCSHELKQQSKHKLLRRRNITEDIQYFLNLAFMTRFVVEVQTILCTYFSVTSNHI